MPNRLAGETSPYLLEHAENPVDWYPWGPEALERARREDRPILLSIGYSACHWCHVMARESFEDPETAALMNRFFVSIKVDREERPDLDQIYMRAVQGMTGSGGWPMTMFLLPDGTPFYGGTYFPPTERHGLPSFKRLLTAVFEAYSLRRQEISRTAGQVHDFLQRETLTKPETSPPLGTALLDQAYEQLARDYDQTNGGFGGAPKFPQPMLMEFLLRTYHRTGRPGALNMATHSLTTMAAGGMYDQLGGGFHRYAVDARWLVPHFEKMLYDNALLSRAYLQAWQLTGEQDYRRVVEETLAFVKRELRSPEGGFFASLDADSEGEEGRFYLWTPAELHDSLGPEAAGRLGRAFDVTPDGNFEGRSILHPVTSGALRVMDEVRPRLLAARARRGRPRRDEKILAGWNGLMLRAFAEAGWAFDREDLLDVARANARFLLTRMRAGQRMLRSFTDGRRGGLGFLEDQAAVADGLLTLYESTFDSEWLDAVRGLVTAFLDGFWDPATEAFYDTARDHEPLVVRPQDVTDNAVPSGTAMAADVLLRAGALLDQPDWVARGVQVLQRLAPAAARAPLAFGRVLAALDFHLGPPTELAFIGDRDAPEMRALLSVVRSRFLPNRIQAQGREGDAPSISLLAHRTALTGRPTAYLCEAFACQAPVTEPTDLAAQLEALNPAR